MNSPLPVWLDVLLDREWTPTASLIIDRYLAMQDAILTSGNYSSVDLASLITSEILIFQPTDDLS